jgi:hypothetical protein
VSREVVMALGLGFSAGFACAWWYFLVTGLIRTRREYYADRRARGEDVPADWERGKPLPDAVCGSCKGTGRQPGRTVSCHPCRGRGHNGNTALARKVEVARRLLGRLEGQGPFGRLEA